MHADRVMLEYSGPGSGGSPFNRKTIVIAAFEPDTPDNALVEITTLRQPRREGRIPRVRLGAVPKEDDARYLKEYWETQSDSGGSPSPSAPSAPPPPPSPSPATSLPAPYGDHPRLFVAGRKSTLETVAFIKGGGKLTLIPVLGDPPLYRHLPGPSLQEKARPEDPDIIDPYHVLGVGAFGISFKLGDTRKGQEDVALKATAAPETDLERMMINNEGYIPAAVHHPNVLPAAGPPLEVQLEPGGPVLRCLLTPFCEGGDLDKVIRRHLRSPSADPDADREERWWLLVDMVRGLAYLHGKPFEQNDRRVLHNDIKPANVLLRPDRATGRLMALLADLGLACEYTGGSANYGLIRGTPGFMAPELYAGNGGLGDAARQHARDGHSDHKTEERPSEEELREAFAEVGDLEAAAGCKVGLVELLVRMCSENPTGRPDMARIRGAVEAVAAALEEAARRRAAEKEAARLKTSVEEAARRRAAEEEAARRKAAVEEAARRRAAEAERAAALELERSLTGRERAALDKARRCTETKLELICGGRAEFMVCLAAWLQTNRTVTKVCLLASSSRPSMAAAGSRLAMHWAGKSIALGSVLGKTREAGDS
ncbi:hypothetical protein PAPYR_9045 [Paratrimastix pyriformis]|uniref:non-specific serine/threonine protein kinase n=1 Tax=Paratrimastix pyriformis TaxID=342808 RepID=A0ABQ8UEW1_9EUKA|nr:hypothetical protein PAPYR_9045 [Paratrimastix pyriformis]